MRILMIQAHKNTRELKGVYPEYSYRNLLAEELRKYMAVDRLENQNFLEGDRVVIVEGCNMSLFDGYTTQLFDLYEVISVDDFSNGITIRSFTNNTIIKRVPKIFLKYSKGYKVDCLQIAEGLLNRAGIKNLDTNLIEAVNRQLSINNFEKNGNSDEVLKIVKMCKYSKLMRISFNGKRCKLYKASGLYSLGHIELNDIIYNSNDMENKGYIHMEGIKKSNMVSLVRTVIHEIGHYIHHNYTNWELFKFPIDGKTKYAHTNKDENFAEAFADLIVGSDRNTKKRDIRMTNILKDLCLL